MTEPSTLHHATAVRLRALASWLESHPDALVHHIENLGHVLLVKQHGFRSNTEIRAAASMVGGEWRLVDEGLLVRLVQPVAPDVDYQLVAARENVDVAELGFASVGRAAA